MEPRSEIIRPIIKETRRLSDIFEESDLSVPKENQKPKGVQKERLLKPPNSKKYRKRSIGPTENEILDILRATQGYQLDLAGYSFCFTGFRDKFVEARLLNRGAKIVSFISVSTSCLIAKDPERETAKRAAAERLGIPVITAQKLFSILFSEDTLSNG